MAILDIAAVGDSHFDYPAWELTPTRRARAEAVDSTATAESVDGLVHLGDVCHEGNWSNMADYVAYLSGDYTTGGGSVWWTLGNHDINDGTVAVRTKATHLASVGQSSANFDAGAADGSYGVVQVGSSHLHLVILDCHYNASGAHREALDHEDWYFGTAQRTAILAAMAAAVVADADAVFLVFCHQKYEHLGGLNNTGKDVLETIASTYDVVAFVHGHLHSGDRAQVAALNDCWELGLTCPADPDDNAYSIFRVDDSDGSFSVIAFGQELSMAAKYPVATGAFETDSTWALSAGGAAGGIAGCNCAPGRWDDIILDAATGAITATAAAKVTVGSITGESGAGASIDFDSNGADVHGDLMMTGGYLKNTGTLTQCGDGDLRQSSAAWAWDKYVLSAGVTVTRQNYVYVQAAEIYGTLAAAASWHRLVVYGPSSSGDHLVIGADATVSTGLIRLTRTAAGGAFTNTGTIAGTITQVEYDAEPSGDYTVTQAGRVELAGGLLIASAHASGGTVTLAVTGGGSLGDVALGASGAVKHGRLAPTGLVAIDSIAHADDADSGSGIDLGSSILEACGNLDFDGMEVTADADDVAHIVGIGSPQIDNFAEASSYAVHAHNCTDGGTNTDIDFDAYAAPGSLALCGAGI